VSDLAPGQYVASAGQLEVEEFPAQNNGVLLPQQPQRRQGHYRRHEHDADGG
jgi:hypothetical protein